MRGMLATEAARHPPARDPMAASFHTRGHTNTSFGQSNMAGRYGSGSNFGGNGGLFPAPIPPPSNGPTSGPPQAPSGFPQMNQNIMNRKAGADSSLYQICVNLRKRLTEVPGFHEHIAEMEEEEADANDATDPVTSMWNCLRRGFPLMTVYNAFRPVTPLSVDPNISEAKMAKHAAFKFLQACLMDLKFPPSEMFLITDLYGENTTGFVKVSHCWIVRELANSINIDFRTGDKNCEPRVGYFTAERLVDCKKTINNRLKSWPAANANNQTKDCE